MVGQHSTLIFLYLFLLGPGSIFCTVCGLDPSIESTQAQAKNTMCPELSSLTNTAIAMETSPCWSCLLGSPSRLLFCPSACPISQSSWQLQLLAGWLDGDKIGKVQERWGETGPCIAQASLKPIQWPKRETGSCIAQASLKPTQWPKLALNSCLSNLTFLELECLHQALANIIQLDWINLFDCLQMGYLLALTHLLTPESCLDPAYNWQSKC